MEIEGLRFRVFGFRAWFSGVCFRVLSPGFQVQGLVLGADGWGEKGEG
jgi:hypothetical protein